MYNTVALLVCFSFPCGQKKKEAISGNQVGGIQFQKHKKVKDLDIQEMVALYFCSSAAEGGVI